MNGNEKNAIAQKVQLNPHVEPHGNYSVEWSYHFPLQPSVRIESEFKLIFPMDKVSGAAKMAVAQANLSTTRLSFADVAEAVRFQSLHFLRDTIWLYSAIETGVFSSSPKESPTQPESARKYFLHKAREYWSTAFFSRVGVILQSDLKQSRAGIRSVLYQADLSQSPDWKAFSAQKRRLLLSFRSAYRLVAARRKWDAIFENDQALADFPSPPPSATAEGNRVFVRSVHDLSELAMMLAAQHVAELQGFVTETVTMYEEYLALLNNGKIFSREEGGDLETSAVSNLQRLLKESEWLAQWARLCGEWRLICKLTPLSDVAADAELAGEYFERLRELKKLHYHYWDLGVDLRPNDRRIDMWIAGGAAGLSAAFAFVGALIWTEARNSGTSMEQQGAIALFIFTVGNVIVYALRDVMKEWLKTKLRGFFNARSGYWTGRCSLQSNHDSVGSQNSSSEKNEDREIPVADVERETHWKKMGSQLEFVAWEAFRVRPEARSTEAHIVKQSWRLPLDEILHGLDSSRHILKLPSLDGVPHQVPVLKKSVFKYQLVVVVKEWKNRELTLLDSKTISGKIIATGDCITKVE